MPCIAPVRQQRWGAGLLPVRFPITDPSLLYDLRTTPFPFASPVVLHEKR